jgi:hypothetical protein
MTHIKSYGALGVLEGLCVLECGKSLMFVRDAPQTLAVYKFTQDAGGQGCYSSEPNAVTVHPGFVYSIRNEIIATREWIQ